MTYHSPGQEALSTDSLGNYLEVLIFPIHVSAGHLVLCQNFQLPSMANDYHYVSL